MIQSLDRGIRILNILASKESLSVTEIAKILEIDKSSASRLLKTLKFHDMVQIDSLTGKYKLGLRILNLSETLKRNINVLTVAKPLLIKLSDELGQSVHLCAYNNGMTYVIDQVKSSKVYTLNANVGMIEPLHCSSVGKCILAYKSPMKIEDLLNNYEFKKYTENTITSKEELIKHLSVIRKQGYSVDNEEMALGVTCIAAPVFDYRKIVKYSIGISGPSNNLHLQEKNIKKLISTAKAISRELGFDYKG